MLFRPQVSALCIGRERSPGYHGPTWRVAAVASYSPARGFPEARWRTARDSRQLQPTVWRGHSQTVRVSDRNIVNQSDSKRVMQSNNQTTQLFTQFKGQISDIQTARQPNSQTVRQSDSYSVRQADSHIIIIQTNKRRRATVNTGTWTLLGRTNAHLPQAGGGRPLWGGLTRPTHMPTRWVQSRTRSLKCKDSMDQASVGAINVLTALATSLKSLHLWLLVPLFTQLIGLLATLVGPPRRGQLLPGAGGWAQRTVGPSDSQTVTQSHSETVKQQDSQTVRKSDSQTVRQSDRQTV